MIEDGEQAEMSNVQPLPSDGAPDIKSTLEGYIPLSSDELFQSLSHVCGILDGIAVPHVLSGGTLLGAVREGDLIAGDSDWDLDILDTDLDRILANAPLFAEKGLRLAYPQYADVFPFSSGGEILTGCERRIVKILDMEGRFHGDLFIYTLFTDGIIRRFSIENDAYFNPKMSFPVYFFENPTSLTLRGVPFHAPAEPELMVERVYGPNWRIPVQRHSRIAGYNFAGAHTNANIEKSIGVAMEKGWLPYYPQAEAWPRPIRFMGKPSSIKWISRHEHPETMPEEVSADLDLGINERNARTVLLYRTAITRLKAKAEKTKKQLTSLKETHEGDVAKAQADIAGLKAGKAASRKKLKTLQQKNDQLKTDAAEQIERVRKEAGDYRKRMFDLRTRHDDTKSSLESQIATLAGDLEASRAKIATLGADHKESLQVALHQVALLSAENRQVEGAVRKLKGKLTSIRSENDTLKADLESTSSKLLTLEGSSLFRALRWFSRKP